MKKSVSLVLAMLLILSCLFGGAALTASAEAEGTGIANLSALEGSNGTFYLTADVGSAENPVTTTVAAFSGTLDGNGHTVYTSVPLFAALNGATVKNLTVEGSISFTNTTTTWADCGALANTTTGLTLDHVTNNASLTVAANSGHVRAGGLIGSATGTLIFSNCVNNGAIAGSSTGGKQVNTGGLVGKTLAGNTIAKTIFTNCVNNGAISNSSSVILLAGGMVGHFERAEEYLFENCSNTADITTSANCKIGGLVGVTNQNVKHEYVNCRNSGTLSGTTFLGGISGQDCAGSLILTDCENSGSILITGSATTYAGGMTGYMNGAGTVAVTNCINSGAITSTSTAGTQLFGGLLGYSDKGTAHTFRDCVNTGAVSSNKQGAGGVKLAGFAGVLSAGTVSFERCVNKGNVSSGTMAGGLVADARKTVTMTDCVNNGAINVTNTGNNNTYAGGLIGQALGATSSVITRCANYADVTALNDTNKVATAGGIAGVIDKAATFVDCASYGKVTGQYIAGGIVGKYTVTSGSFTRCLFAGTIYSDYYYGNAIIGNMSANNTDAATVITLTDCYGTFVRAAGVYAADNTVTNGNLRYVYTAEGIDETLIGGSESFSDCGTPGDVYTRYNQVWTANAFRSASLLSGTNAAKILTAYGIGSGTWVLREGYPELAVADTLLGAATNAKADASIVYEGVQNTAVSEGTYAARFVSKVEGTEFSAVGVRIRVVTSGSATVLGTEQSSGAVYEQILGADEDGVATAYPEAPVEGIYYSALTLTGIPAAGTYTFVVTPFTVSADGQTTDEGGAIAIVYTDGAYVTQYWFAAPTR